MIFHSRPILLALTALSLAASSAAAAESMTLRADLTEAPRGLIRGKLSIPVKPGKLTLVYPQWIPGYHSPIGPVTDLAGVKFNANGKPVTWRPRPRRHVRFPRRCSRGRDQARRRP